MSQINPKQFLNNTTFSVQLPYIAGHSLYRKSYWSLKVIEYLKQLNDLSFLLLDNHGPEIVKDETYLNRVGFVVIEPLLFSVTRRTRGVVYYVFEVQLHLNIHKIWPVVFLRLTLIKVNKVK